MPHLVRWHNELSDYGLVIIGPHVQGGPKEKVKAKATSLGLPFTVTTGASIKNGLDFSGIPHVILFDSTGKCLFRGSPEDVEKELRPAVGKALADGIDKPSKTTAAFLDALAKGQSPALILPKVVPLMKSTNTQTADEAKKLIENMTAVARKRVEDADSLKGTDAVGSYLLVEQVPTTFKGTPVASKASEILAEVKKDMAVQAELKARPSLEAIRKVDTYLAQTADKARVDITDATFLKANATSLDQMKKALAQMNKSWPDSRATQQAAALCEKYGVK